VVSRSFGISNAQAWGHRGATHSIVFAVTVGTAAAVLARRWGSGQARLVILGIAVVLSHPLLDMLTFGARGCALLWPFDDTRYLAGWRPLAASPIGLGLISQRGLTVMLTETVIFAPLLYWALRRGRATSS
jgi:inner membrane protein